MVIILNKDRSVQMVTPSTVYQGSNLADELTVFAPFSVKSYPAILVNFQLPSGEYLPRSVAFYTATQPDGFGAWSMQLDSKITSIPGTVKVSFTLISSYTGIDESTQPITITNPGPTANTAPAEFTVTGDVKYIEPSSPSDTVYYDILQGLSAILNRNVNWDENDPSSPAYILNKPPISATKDDNGAVDGVIVSGNLLVSGDITSDGVNFSDKLDKQTFSDNQHPNDIGVYAVSGDNQFIETATATPDANAGGCIALYGEGGKLSTQDPQNDEDCANKKYVDDVADTKVTKANFEAPLEDAIKVYGINFNNTQETFQASWYPYAKNIAMRDEYGNICVSDNPTRLAECINVNYFRNNLKLSYNRNNGYLLLKDSEDVVLGEVDLPLESTVSNAEFDPNENDLVITFTNGSTTRIPVDALANPAWVNNLNTMTIEQENIPPTAGATKSYVDNISNTKLDKKTVEDGSYPLGAVYAVQGNTQKLIGLQKYGGNPGDRVALYDSTGHLSSADPVQQNDCVSLRFMRANTASAIMGVVSGSAFRITDGVNLDIAHITTSPAISNVKVYQGNLLDTSQVEAFSTNQNPGSVTDYGSGNVVWESGTNYIKFPIYIPKGAVVNYQFTSDQAGVINRVRFWGETIGGEAIYVSPTTTDVKISGTFVATKGDIYYMTIYKDNPSMPLETPVLVNNIAVWLGTEAFLLPGTNDFNYVAPRDVTLENGEADFELYPSNTIIPPPGSNTLITVTYRRDSSKVIDFLTRKVEELQLALTT